MVLYPQADTVRPTRTMAMPVSTRAIDAFMTVASPGRRFANDAADLRKRLTSPPAGATRPRRLAPDSDAPSDEPRQGDEDGRNRDGASDARGDLGERHQLH